MFGLEKGVFALEKGGLALEQGVGLPLVGELAGEEPREGAAKATSWSSSCAAQSETCNNTKEERVRGLNDDGV